MCYAIPGQVKAINDKTVVVDYFGEEKRAINDLINLNIGDYIYAQGGYVIEKVAPAQALEVLALWKETFFELQEVDVRLSKLYFEEGYHDTKLSRILDRALERSSLSRSDLHYLFSVEEKAANAFIYKCANFLRQKYLKNSCCVHGIIEISNICSQNCFYCGISSHNQQIKRYRMSEQEIVDTALSAIKDYGFKALVLQSGEDSFFSPDKIAKIIREIKKQAGVLIAISFGEIGFDGLKTVYDAGARAMLMRFETSNPLVYSRLHPGRNLDTRIAHLKRAGELGYLIMTGALVGIPGQTPDDVFNDIFLAKELNAEMFSFGPFLPHPNTPIAGYLPWDKDKIFKVLAIARILDPENAKILVTTAFETLHPDARKEGLLCGANSVMLNVTPAKYRALYSLYPNRAHVSESINSQIQDILALLRSLGRAPTDLGVSEKIFLMEQSITEGAL
ncbi:MAG: [FeFe] hydrogenase H-cluster radical SAM maturase HydE [Candidatus Omnitrophica bacterium]|nr:[FeFe] hydrogenase H-cluster radical SAM maturase HydE [Candidatus Omnitrophota bacterium]